MLTIKGGESKGRLGDLPINQESLFKELHVYFAKKTSSLKKLKTRKTKLHQ